MSKSIRCFYSDSFDNFLKEEDSSIFGKLCDTCHGDMRTTTRESWNEEISVMKNLLSYTNVYEFGGIIDWDGEVVKE